MTEGRTRVVFRLGGQFDVTAWQARHARGEVPDAWPYGLHRLADYGLDVRPAPAFAGNRTVARGLRALGRYEWLETGSMGTSADVALCWDERVGVPAGWRAGGSGGPRVVTGVIWLTDERRASRLHRTLAAGLRRAHRVWALSSAQLPVLRDEFGVPAGRLVHVPFGIDADFFHPGGEPVPGLVVGAGNDRHRDHGTLIAALAEVRRQDSAVRLELATGQPVELPAEWGVRHAELTHVQIRALYRRSAVTVVALYPNLHVSGITVALEAMACARPVVITDTPGMRDYVEHGVTGLLVAPGDTAALARAVRELLADPERAREMGLAGRRAVEDRFTTQVQAGHLAAMLA